MRLIRSKGVGVFFITQLPDDVPDDVLAQLGNRVQHALRAFTPRDAKALKAAVTTYPNTDDYDLEEDLTQLGIGEAMVTILSERGAPTPVVWTRMRPPTSLMAALPTDEVDASAQADPLVGRVRRRRSIPSRPARSSPPRWRRRATAEPAPRPRRGEWRSAPAGESAGRRRRRAAERRTTAARSPTS